MATNLVKWNGYLPDRFHDTVSHMWLQHEDGKVEVVERRKYRDENGREIPDDEIDWSQPGIHADHWGDMAWETESRGYYSKQTGIVTAHISLAGKTDLINKLARKFSDAVYYRE